MDTEASIWGFAAALVTGLGYVQARGVWKNEEASIANYSVREFRRACLGLAHGIVVSLFGPRYWTLRGLGSTTGLCWVVYGMALLMNGSTLRFGQSGYPTIATLIMGFLLFLPFLIHLILHAIRIGLAFGGKSKSTWKNTTAATLLLALPVAVSVSILFPVAIIASMVDAESLMTRDVLSNWATLSHMFLWEWATPRPSGLVSVISILFNGPTLMLWLYLISYGTWFTLRRLLPHETALGRRIARRPFVALGLVNALFTFLLSITLYEIIRV